MSERNAYIALNMMEGIGPVSVRSLAAVLGSAEAIFQADKHQLRKAEGIGDTLAEGILAQRDLLGRVEDEIEKAGRLGAALITPLDSVYPDALRQLHDPPLALYVMGQLDPADKHAIAIVGSRHATLYGRETAEKLAYQLVHTGFTVVSGLARGIDTAAHQGALKGKGRTLAVIGSGMDCLTPPENRELARAIAEQGAVLSEFPLGKQPDKTTFPIRNRIVSGLSMGLVVVEAGLSSGALITAHAALEQGRSVFAVPGRVDSPASKGTHQLIKNGAKLVEDAEDILQEFEFLFPASAAQGDTAAETVLRNLPPDEASIVTALEDGEMEVDALIRATGLKPSAVSSLLIGLEMKKLVRMLPGRIVERVRRRA